MCKRSCQDRHPREKRRDRARDDVAKDERELLALAKRLCLFASTVMPKSRVAAIWADHDEASRQPRKIKFQILRDTSCSHLAMRVVPHVKSRKLAGDQDLGTTQRYMHLSPRHSTRQFICWTPPPETCGVIEEAQGTARSRLNGRTGRE